MEDKIVHVALENLLKHTGMKAFYTAKPKKGIDGEVEFVFQKEKVKFLVGVKREIRNHQLIGIEELAMHHKNFLLIAETILPKIKEELRKQGIAYLDTAGNIFMKTEKHHLWIDGHKKQKTTDEKPDRAFKAGGLKLIYLFLTNENLLNQPQRTIAEEAGIALGNIGNILNGLKVLGFLIELSKKEFQLINKNELLQKWMTGYEDILKPALHIGNFRFASTDDERNWKELKFKEYETYWGGEPAGNLITNYLQPGIFTIYTEETRSNLIKNYHLVPEQNGTIKVYKKFWKNHNGLNENVVHPILAYTDLVNTGNSRCIETAKIIYEKYIKPII